MIAYLGNWQACPTPEQYEEYTHIVIAFAVSYTWNPSKNNCDSQCTIGSPVPICSNQNRQDLVDLWRSQGKKVILSFGGAGMGGSWAGDNNDCWEYCFGREASVVSQLDTIVRAQNFDGVDIDYEYFYNDGDAFNLPGSTGAKARYFLDTITRDLKTTLPAGQNLITHAPMEPDSEKGTAYYDILKANAANLDFLMPQYYNGWTRPALDGLTGTGAGSKAALPHYHDLVDDMFEGDATKVVFGFCISDCSGTGSNANAVQASAVMNELNGYYSCNGGAFFWVVNHDYGGGWSSAVGDAAGVGENNCGPVEPTISPRPTPSPPPPTVAPPTAPTSCPNSNNVCGPGNPCADGACCSPWGYCGTTEAYCGECCQSNCSGAPTSAPPPPTSPPAPTPNPPTNAPPTIAPPTNAPPTAAPPPPTSSPGPPPTDLVAGTHPRCGTSETNAREMCGPECTSSADCASGEWCWGMHPNYCSDPNFTPPGYTETTISSVYYRCGNSEVEARSFCQTPCNWASDCDQAAGETCYAVNQNYCGASTSRRVLLRGGL